MLNHVLDFPTSFLPFAFLLFYLFFFFLVSFRDLSSKSTVKVRKFYSLKFFNYIFQN